MSNNQTRQSGVRKVQRGIMLISILAKVAMLILLLYIVPANLRWIVLFIFVPIVIAQTMILVRHARR